MAMDAEADIRAPAMADFRLYCRRVAGAVGVLSVHAFGATEPEAHELALAEGDALQFTNILRDLAEDAARGRPFFRARLRGPTASSSADPTKRENNRLDLRYQIATRHASSALKKKHKI